MPKTQSLTPSDARHQTTAFEQREQGEVEKHKRDAEESSKRKLDQEAIAAIEQTRKAADASSAGKVDEARAAVDEATRRVNTLVGRNAANALVPVNSEVRVIDTAPHEIQAILEVAQDASRALDEKNYPTARALLHSLMSEIRVRTYNLPLATYPDVLKEAARLLDQKETARVRAVLLTALNTLIVVDHVTPLPLIFAKEALQEAQRRSAEDRNAARDLVMRAEMEVERARELGYAGKSKEYADLISEISKMEKQLADKDDVATVLLKIKNKLTAFLKKQSTQVHG